MWIDVRKLSFPANTEHPSIVDETMGDGRGWYQSKDAHGGVACVNVSASGTRVDGVAGLDVDDLSQQSVRDPPVAFRIIDGDRRSFRVEPDDDADPLAQMFVGEDDGVADEEFLSLSSRWRRRRRVSWAARSVRNNSRV
jgi:hypothetical protein